MGALWLRGAVAAVVAAAAGIDGWRGGAKDGGGWWGVFEKEGLGWVGGERWLGIQVAAAA